ncbi:MAG TPA: glycine/sarcosine/betaine reductase selenoprotein B family protein [Terriglobia bacterium]|jgi:D-proline reductase (dithiol) PrdB
MAELSDLPLWEQVFMKAYPYRQARWSRPATVTPLAAARAALITTAGLHLPGQPPFDESIKGGDWSFRWIPGDVEVQSLRISHRSRSFDREGVLRDRNLAFPLDRFRELVAEGILGSLSDRHLSFMGSITAPGRLLRDTAPEAARTLRAGGVSLAFLVPV